MLKYFINIVLLIVFVQYGNAAKTKEGCEYPENAVKIQRKNQKAWDKCIDLADSIWSCRNTGSSMVLEDNCQIDPNKLETGEIAEENEFPHMALLGYGHNERTVFWVCGGTLISEEWVLTAGHCLNLLPFTSTDVKYVRFGGGNLSVQADPQLLFQVVQTIIHPEYRYTAKYNDIGLIKLNKKVNYSRRVRPACLHTGEQIKDDKVISIGYETIQSARSKSSDLRKFVLEKLSFEDCKRAYPPSRRFLNGLQNDSQICYGSNKKDDDNCQGEAGTPIQIYNTDVHCTFKVIGIKSFGKGCAVNSPVVFTRVSAFISWIEKVVWP